MNYFERLVRRALLQPAPRTGAAPADPFEGVDDWPLASVAARAPSDAPAVAPPPPGMPVAARVADPEEPEGTWRSPAATLAVLPLAADPSDVPLPRLIEAEAEEPAPVPTPVAAAVTPPVQPAPAIAPLERADLFMRDLGVPLLRPEAAVGAEPPVPMAVPEPVSLPITRDPRPGPRAQAVMPPPPPPPPAPDSPSFASDSRDGRGAAAATSLPGPAHGNARVIEARRLLVVEKASARRGEDAVSGGGAPHFGLGQL